MDIVFRNSKQLPLATSLTARKFGMDNIRVPESAQLSSKLCMAILRHDNSEVKEFIRQGALIDYQDEPDGWTPLIYSIYYGNRHAREILFSLDADINLTDFANRTALMFAAIAGDSGLLKELLQRGAKADATDHQGKTALDFAREYRREECVKFLENITKQQH